MDGQTQGKSKRYYSQDSPSDLHENKGSKFAESRQIADLAVRLTKFPVLRRWDIFRAQGRRPEEKNLSSTTASIVPGMCMKMNDGNLPNTGKLPFFEWPESTRKLLF